ncbi:two-component system sensor histidine kinase TctE [Collimonas sp. PA-H2]|uniref:sensor histidine kinase n=1 Tax=Collimonas sp. PA-H2 TaxID=1881062 RepID=UPI000BF553F1|nr:sensor histidine kinase [Collimonas sp. PA-H2]PFH09039.1 two-component system sensor histidine kinase TctE [Collimonas sp. PA-H2]
MALSPDALPTTHQPTAPLAQQAEERVQRSLFGEILDWMLVPLLLLWPISIAITYVVAKTIANQPFDQALDDSVMVLSQQVIEINGKVATRLNGPARDFLRADDIDNVYYLITDARGNIVEGDRDLIIPPAIAQEDTAHPGTVQHRDAILHGNDVRIAYAYVDLRSVAEVNATAPPRTALVQVAETLEKRARLANAIIKGVILPQFLILPIVLALIWFALSRGLSPLSELQQRIRARRPDDLSPIDSGQVPEEISPLVRSLNDMLERLSLSIQTQKRFIADAAHQMKTPLAGMRMQSELALRQTRQEDIHRSLEQLAKSSESATRLVNQLLSLARAENQSQENAPFVQRDLSEFARGVVQDWVQASFTQRIDLGFEQAEQPLPVMCNPLMLRELLGNLIDNALHYTPVEGRVTVRVRADGEPGQAQFAILEVEDTGPGIPPAERDHIFQRFYRILDSSRGGSGLGLAIVREIALQHDAQITISYNPHSSDLELPGSLFRVSLHLLKTAKTDFH